MDTGDRHAPCPENTSSVRAFPGLPRTEDGMRRGRRDLLGPPAMTGLGRLSRETGEQIALKNAADQAGDWAVPPSWMPGCAYWNTRINPQQAKAPDRLSANQGSVTPDAVELKRF